MLIKMHFWKKKKKEKKADYNNWLTSNNPFMFIKPIPFVRVSCSDNMHNNIIITLAPEVPSLGHARAGIILFFFFFSQITRE